MASKPQCFGVMTIRTRISFWETTSIRARPWSSQVRYSMAALGPSRQAISTPHLLNIRVSFGKRAVSFMIWDPMLIREASPSMMAIVIPWLMLKMVKDILPRCSKTALCCTISPQVIPVASTSVSMPAMFTSADGRVQTLMFGKTGQSFMPSKLVALYVL